MQTDRISRLHQSSLRNKLPVFQACAEQPPKTGSLPRWNHCRPPSMVSANKEPLHPTGKVQNMFRIVAAGASQFPTPAPLCFDCMAPGSASLPPFPNLFGICAVVLLIENCCNLHTTIARGSSFRQGVFCRKSVFFARKASISEKEFLGRDRKCHEREQKNKPPDLTGLLRKAGAIGGALHCCLNKFFGKS